MKISKMSFMVLSFLLIITSVNASSIDYQIIIEENGDSLVIMTIYGSDLVNIHLQEDVEEVKIKGALYMINENSIDVSIGSTEKAIILYKTSLLTSKEKDIWNFDIGLTDHEEKQVTVIMPNNTNVLNTEPQAMIESLNFLKLNWEGNMSNVSFQYSFLNENLGDLIELEIQETNNSLDTFKIGFGLFVLTGSIIFLYFKRTKLKKLQNKQNIMRTLPTNENKIVEVLLKRKYGMKRSKLEKITKIAKSSLSSSLKNLERKNIIEIDKTYTSHYIRFTKWFNDL